VIVVCIPSCQSPKGTRLKSSSTASVELGPGSEGRSLRGICSDEAASYWTTDVERIPLSSFSRPWVWPGLTIGATTAYAHAPPRYRMSTTYARGVPIIGRGLERATANHTPPALLTSPLNQQVHPLKSVFFPLSSSS